MISQLGRTVFGGRGIPYLLVISATTVILIMAANTAFADFPRLSALAAADGYLPDLADVQVTVAGAQDGEVDERLLRSAGGRGLGRVIAPIIRGVRLSLSLCTCLCLFLGVMNIIRYG